MARYRKGAKINSGGFGIVYRATRIEDGETVAFKQLVPTASAEDKQRFVREVTIQAKLLHGNVVSILGYNLKTDPPWFVMPLARGNLRDELPSLAGNLKAVNEVFQQILDGVEHAHVNGIVHRDLKPENVLFFDDPEWPPVKISDFGLGKRLDNETILITPSSENKGTPPYFPPEQAVHFKHVDERGDIFSLGRILYEMLTGDIPYFVDTKHAKLPSGYGYLISKCLEHEPDNRYQTICELRDDFLLLTNPTKFAKPVQRAEEIVNHLLGKSRGNPAALKELDELLQTHEDDEVLYTTIFPRLHPTVIQHYQAKFKHRFYQRLRRFDQFVQCSLPFAYTDVVADFYQKVYLVVPEADIKRLLLTRLLEMGYSHNRFYVRTVLVNVLQSIKTGTEALLARDVLRQNCSAAVWCSDECPGGNVLPVIAEAFTKCKQQLRGPSSESL